MIEELVLVQSGGTATTTEVLAERCRVCDSKAMGFNYFVVCCNACKMFFRRAMVDKLEYKCKLSGKCFENIGEIKRTKCKSCRFDKCVEVGMKYIPRGEGETRNQLLPRAVTSYEDSWVKLIGPLLNLDSQRDYYLHNVYTDDDPTIEKILSKHVRGFSGLVVGIEKDLPPVQWSFLSVFTSAEFLANLDFMTELELTDRVILVKNFAFKSSMLASCFRCMKDNYDHLVNPNGITAFPDSILQIPTFTKGFLNRISRLLISHFVKMRITQEEYMLANIILFCNSALPGLSPKAQFIVSTKQKQYCAVLLKYCLWKYQGNGPARLSEIISLGTVLTNVFEGVQSLLTIFQMYMPGTKHPTVIQESFPNTSF